jgi:two-component system response regulator YesN
MLKVLLVDDEPYVLMGLSTMVDWAENGFSVYTATNGEEAIEIIKAADPDLIITDIKMPGINGIELIRYSLEELHSAAEFVILSGYDDFSYAKEAMRYHVNDYILKPLDDEELRQLVVKMAALIREKNRKAQDDRKQLSFLLNQSIKRAIKGEKKPSVLQRIGTLLHIAEGDEVICVLIDIGPANKEHWIEIREKAYEIARKRIEERLGRQFLLHLFQDDMGRFGIMVTEHMPFFHSIGPFAQALMNDMKTPPMGTSPTVGVSLPGKGTRSFPAIYQQASLAMNYKFYTANSNIIFYQDIRNQTLDNRLCANDFSALLESILRGRDDEIDALVNQLFDTFSSGLRAQSAIIASLKYFDCELIKLIMEMDCDQDAFSRTVLQFEKSMEHLTMQEIKEAFLDHCHLASGYIQSVRRSNPSSIISEIQGYIRENYEKDIKLKNLAQMFSMNPIYLGQLFKKTTGMQFTDYLNSVRVEEAKKALAHTDMSIHEVAQAVGFRDAKYFSYKFKTITSLSPTAYKKHSYRPQQSQYL